MNDPNIDRAAPGVDRHGIVPPPAFAIEEAPAPEGVVLLRLLGELDLAASGPFRERVDGAFQRGASTLVVDMQETLFIDSSILKELLGAAARAAELDRRLVLAGVHGPVRRLLDLTRASDLLTIAPTAGDALADAHRRPPS